jgi:hypothetical protein
MHPQPELKIEGDLVLDLIDGWGIPRDATQVARTLWKEASTDEQIEQNALGVPGALHALFNEKDAWSDYLDDYNSDWTTWLLFAAVLVFLIVAVLLLHYASRFSPLVVFGILAAGLAGSCASIMSKMPTLAEELSRKRDAHTKPSVSHVSVSGRIATGLVGSIVGCALLSWVPLSIKGISFGDLVALCTKQPCSSAGANSCSTVSILILLGVPTLLGFSERTMVFFEERFFGEPQRKRQRKRS